MIKYLVIGAMVLLALAVVGYDRWRTARTMKRLDDMLTAAINGSFSETAFDESRLSALESRLWRYLTASALSERNVREQKDQISALISDISHQTKTPVANLQLYAQLLSEQPLTPQGKDCAAAISAQAEKLQTLIEALVKTSRLETGILALHPQPGEISPVVERAAAQHAARAAEKGIALTVGQAEGSAVFDPKWTEEAVCNLLDNAVKYAGEGGRIQLRAGRRGRGAFLEVANPADNLPEGDLDRLFDRFYRADSSRARATGGYGIGLSIARAIAEAHGGRITARRGEGEIRFLVALRAGIEGPGGRK